MYLVLFLEHFFGKNMFGFALMPLLVKLFLCFDKKLPLFPPLIFFKLVPKLNLVVIWYTGKQGTMHKKLAQ